MGQALQYDAVIVGAGPNGLAAAITLSRRGRRVLVLEGAGRVGGGARSVELTLPGFTHDVCSAVHPLAIASPLFSALPLAAHGLEWVHPELPLAHPLEDGAAVELDRSVQRTASLLGEDGDPYRRLFSPLVAAWPSLIEDVLAPIRVPRHPLATVRFGRDALRSAAGLVRRFRGEGGRALLAGLAAHSVMPLEKRPTAAFALLLGAAGHASGWPSPRGGSQRLADALASYLRSLGGEIEVDRPVISLDELPSARAVLCDVTPRQLLRMAGDRLPRRYQRALERFRYGPAVFKLDWALEAPIPWQAEACRGAGTVHVGGGFETIAAGERAVWNGRIAERPFVLLAQPTLADSSRAPQGRHVAWAYCHVPHGSGVDMTERVEAEIERFAPGFRARILARHAMGPEALERRNPNLVGGSIGGGVQDARQVIARPTLRTYRTPLRGLYLCSSSTPPGGGVHGMCGYHAAMAALADGL